MKTHSPQVYVDFLPLSKTSTGNDIVDVDDRTVSLFDPVCGVNTKMTFTGCTKGNGNSLPIALQQLEVNLLEGYNVCILLLDHFSGDGGSCCSTSNSIILEPQVQIKQILESLRETLGKIGENQLFLEFALESATLIDSSNKSEEKENASQTTTTTTANFYLPEAQWKNADFFDEIVHACEKAASSLQMLRIKIRVQGKFVCFFSLICLPEAGAFLYGESALGRSLKQIISSTSTTSSNGSSSSLDLSVNPALKALFDNSFSIVVASCSCSSEVTRETVSLLELLEGFCGMKLVLFPNNNSYELLDEYQETSLEVVEALEGELQKIYLVKDAISKELVAVNNEFLAFQSFSKGQFELFMQEERKRAEAEQLLCKASLECLLEQIEETQNGLLTLSQTYRADIQQAKKDQNALSASISQLNSTISALKVEKAQLQEQVSKLQDTNEKNSSLLLEAQSQLGKLSEENSQLQEALVRAQKELAAKLEQEKKKFLAERQELEESFKGEIEQLQAKVEKSVECNKATQNAIKALTREKSDLQEKLEEANERSSSLQEELSNLTQIVKELKKIPKRKPSDEALTETISSLRQELEAEREAHAESLSRLERESQSAKSSSSLRMKRIERDLEEERENVHALSRERDSLLRQLERLRETNDSRMNQDVKEAIDRERAAVKSERIEMRSLLKESQEKILELQDELRKAHGLTQQQPALKRTNASSKPIDFLFSQQHPIEQQQDDDEEALPTSKQQRQNHHQFTTSSQSKKAKQTTKQKNTVLSDEEPLEAGEEERFHSKILSSKQASKSNSTKTVKKNAISSIPLSMPPPERPNATPAPAPAPIMQIPTPTKRYSTIPAAQTKTNAAAGNSANPLKSASFKPNFESSSVLSGVSFNASFMEAAKKTKLGYQNLPPNAASAGYEHRKVLNLVGEGNSLGQKRNVPSEILNDFKLPNGK